jgi:hypothetical protein
LGCSLVSDCDDADLSRQVVYSVDLHYTNLPFSSFNLDYQSLYVEVVMKLMSTIPNFSSINVATTQACNKSHLSQWPNVIFNVTPEAASIEFMDEFASSCPEDILKFVKIDEGEGKLHLFDIVVDAYPGEIIKMKNNVFQLTPQGSSPSCQLADITENSSAPYTVPNPVSAGPLGSAVQVRILPNPQPLPNGDVEFTFFLRNTDGSSPVEVNYIDFIAKLNLSQALAKPKPLPSSGFSATSYGTGTEYFIRFYNPTPNVNYTIAPGGTKEIGKVLVYRPVVTDQCWTATASLPQDNKARVRTTIQGCKALTLSGQSVTYTPAQCTPNCTFTPASEAGFTVGTHLDLLDKCVIHFRIGLVALPGTQITNMTLSNIKFRLRLEQTGNFTLNGFHLGDFACNNSNNTCADPLFNGTLISWDQTYLVGHSIQVQGNGAFMDISLSGEGCIDKVTLEDLSITLIAAPECIPTIIPILPNPICASKAVGGLLTTEANVGIEDAQVFMFPTAANISCSTIPTEGGCIFLKTTGKSGGYGFCDVCTTEPSYTVRPILNLDPINGVNAWDLVLISRHILNLEPLNTPYKLISADANRSGTVSTFDIVQFRKLILGTFTSFSQMPDPMNQCHRSWRFVNAAQVFTNPANPFADIIQEEIIVPASIFPKLNAHFVGCKLGDVDVSATPNNKMGLQNKVPISIGLPAQKSVGNYLSIPIIYSGNEVLDAYQFALYFDPTKLGFVSVSQGDIKGFNVQNFGFEGVNNGEIKTLWYFNPYTDERPLQQGDILFYLNLNVLDRFALSSEVLKLKDAPDFNFAWSPEGAIFGLSPANQAEARKLDTENVVELAPVVSPNPTNGVVRIQFASSKEFNGVIQLFDSYGKMIVSNPVKTAVNGYNMTIDALVQKPSGLYLWKIVGVNTNYCGYIIKN